MYNLIITALLIMSFFMCVSSFTIGIKMGKSLSSGKLPQFNINPIKTIKEYAEKVEAQKQEEILQEELSDILGATKESMLKAIKNGVSE